MSTGSFSQEEDRKDGTKKSYGRKQMLGKHFTGRRKLVGRKRGEKQVTVLFKRDLENLFFDIIE